MQSLQIFEKGTYNVKTYVYNETAYFSAKDVAKSLDYKNPAKAVRDHVFEEDRLKFKDLWGNVTFTPSQQEQGHSVYITEAGVYALIFGSQKEEAKVFKKWVNNEVLPKLRKYYHEQTKAPLALRNEADLHHKIIQSIRRFWPYAVLVAGLGELQDTPEKRLFAWRCGYAAGTPDILILNAHKSHNGFAIELKNPKGTGKVTDKQLNALSNYHAANFKTLVSDEYDVVFHELVKYFMDTRLMCDMCGKKIKTEQTLQPSVHEIFH